MPDFDFSKCVEFGGKFYWWDGKTVWVGTPVDVAEEDLPPDVFDVFQEMLRLQNGDKGGNNA